MACIRYKALDLSGAGTYNDSAVSWTAVNTANTAVVVSASLDGESFTQVASSGDPIPGLSAGQDLSGVFVTVRVEFQTTEPTESPELQELQVMVEGEGPALRGGADYYSLGQLTWLTGNNAGRTIEVRNWDLGTRTLSLFLKMPEAIQVGDLFELLPGCRKRLEDCRDKFANVVNMRAEPYVPGNDQLFKIPDAQSI